MLHPACNLLKLYTRIPDRYLWYRISSHLHCESWEIRFWKSEIFVSTTFHPKMECPSRFCTYVTLNPGSQSLNSVSYCLQTRGLVLLKQGNKGQDFCYHHLNFKAGPHPQIQESTVNCSQSELWSQLQVCSDIISAKSWLVRSHERQSWWLTKKGIMQSTVWHCESRKMSGSRHYHLSSSIHLFPFLLPQWSWTLSASDDKALSLLT